MNMTIIKEGVLVPTHQTNKIAILDFTKTWVTLPTKSPRSGGVATVTRKSCRTTWFIKEWLQNFQAVQIIFLAIKIEVSSEGKQDESKF